MVEAATRGEWIAIRGLEPVRLIVNMYATYDRALRHHCGPVRGSYRRFGPDIADARCANCDRDIRTFTWEPPYEGNPEIERRCERLSRAGIKYHVGDYTDPGITARVRMIETTPKSLQIVRQLAIEDVAGSSREAAQAFVDRLNRYINQNYAYDWEEWLALGPLETWPWFEPPPTHLTD